MKEKIKIILIHGFSKNSKDMKYLKNELCKRNYSCVAIDLPLTFKKMEINFEIFRNKMTEIINNLEEGEKIVFISHSAGGFIVRNFLILEEYHNLIKSCILIAPPNQGSIFANFFYKYTPLRLFCKTLEGLTTDNFKDLEVYREDKIDIGVIAGNKDNILLGKIFYDEIGDGRVSLESTKLENSKDHIIIPYNHHNIHYNKEVIELIINFIKQGKF
ncbi:MAG: alpha/beta hydrolase [Cetobacterium sp.]|uniref:alpha/beta hydrolase n=1 Tax=Cetobacterium sp. TaxID=2071632 RepID=UPI002FCB6E32